MAVLIASNLRKEFSGDPLFDGVSFKVERRDRVALAGPNGAGKTTLLRALVGETNLHGGDVVFQKGTRVALHDQRPPLERRLTLREYVLSGARDLIALEEELRRLERAMAAGEHDDATIRRYGEAQARLEHAGGYDWRERATAVVRGLGFAPTNVDFRPVNGVYPLPPALGIGPFADKGRRTKALAAFGRSAFAAGLAGVGPGRGDP